MRQSLTLAGALIAGTILAAPVLAQPAPPSPPPLAYVQPLPQPAVQDVQGRLQQAGMYGGRIDGIWGADSQAALEKFQQAHQLQVTGQLNQATAATLGLDPTAWQNPQPPQTTAAAVPPSPSTLRPSSVQAIQARLRSLGFYNGAVDGAWGPSTEAALVRYQQANNLQPNGQPNAATISAMGLAPDTLAYR